MSEDKTKNAQNKTMALSPLQKFGMDLNTVYKKQITNFLGDEKTAMKFISSIVADMQRNPKLIECSQSSLINSYMTMAQLGFMPSLVSGEAYVLPYDNKKKVIDANGKETWIKQTEAQLQVGYQGLVTLFYKAGVEKIVAEVVREKDNVEYVNGEFKHSVNFRLSREERGPAIGAYVIVRFGGVDNFKYMNGKDIIEHASRYSKSYDPTGKYSPWNPSNDAEYWMWKKTVLKQHSKLLPKNETINKAIEIDNQDSRISDIKKLQNNNSLSMGNFKQINDKNNDNKNKEDENQDQQDSANGEKIIDITE